MVYIQLCGRQLDAGTWGNTHARVDVFWVEVTRALAALRGSSTNKRELELLLFSGLAALAPAEFDSVVELAESRCDARIDEEWVGKAAIRGGGRP